MVRTCVHIAKDGMASQITKEVPYAQLPSNIEKDYLEKSRLSNKSIKVTSQTFIWTKLKDSQFYFNTNTDFYI